MSKRSLETGDEYLRPRKRLQAESYKSFRNHDHRIAISKLSDEIILNVFNMLSLEQILSCQSVCRRWHQIATDPEVHPSQQSNLVMEAIIFYEVC
jgi:F-box domain